MADTVILTAAGQVGVHEGRSNGNWNNIQRYSDEVPGLEWSQGQPWCATFVSWVALRAGAASLLPCTASCTTGVGWFQDQGRFSEYPAVGAQAFYGVGGSEHTGVVERFDATFIYTVEGNTNVNGSAEGDGVYRRVRERKSARVYGYGYPKYAGGIDSADPAWPRPTPVPHPVDLEPFPGAQWFHTAPHSPIITAMGRRLVAEGVAVYTQGPGPQWTDTDRRSYAAFQVKIGYRGTDADGWPGPVSWAQLRVPKG
ncbi:peptidoglycan-binding protein [Streptomyces sp. H10-C2]|uniref:peptidoglycan-binding protein n=1 Tax=Streptomyces sp. H10-C2 TaxID=3046210 RepID=UPI0024BB2CD7|nr:peptidoglycan-binding protein [Streptomyces sp. H10-C2]MDJ0371585.1 peptidoglycan-binding protein [Streptomyces sp. H10-C2]